MNATQLATKYTLVSTFVYDHAEFFDSWEYTAKKLEGQSYDQVTHLDLTFRSWGGPALEVNCHGPNARMLMRRVCKMLGGKWDKETTSYEFRLKRTIEITPNETLEVTVCTDREAVCTPRKVGTTTRVIPASEERTVTEDVIEWDCPPSLLELTND